jgi:hypothetical protein
MRCRFTGYPHFAGLLFTGFTVFGAHLYSFLLEILAIIGLVHLCVCLHGVLHCHLDCVCCCFEFECTLISCGCQAMWRCLCCDNNECFTLWPFVHGIPITCNYLQSRKQPPPPSPPPPPKKKSFLVVCVCVCVLSLLSCCSSSSAFHTETVLVIEVFLPWFLEHVKLKIIHFPHCFQDAVVKVSSSNMRRNSDRWSAEADWHF